VVDAALDHSSHRDRAGGRRIRDLVQELQKTVDELAGTPARPSRSNGEQHHAVVTPRGPDRSDFAKGGEAIAAFPYPPQRLVIADLAPIDNDPYCLAVAVYHHEVEGRREGVILEGFRQRVRVVSLVKPHRQHTAIWADCTKDAGLLHSDIDAVAQRLLKIFFHLRVSIGYRECVGERRALLTHQTF
jgi:hypothetical protein